ncbi:hypothetical protein CQW23_26137 [Capsicum baccatum]|uniref:Protein kinase domain-containing protein n=1 Tax=Capsicum baccatum TaxID=33114 RepID=A0A2G2VMZ4_CAPBA|nr:hypothetical protein CQW23_26137 [Capsicum baccatum]
MEEVGVGMVMEEEEWRRWLVVVHMVGGIVAVKEGEREVATLSRLQHQHVVRYYQAWYETGITVSCDDSSCGSRTVVSSSFTFVDGSMSNQLGQENKLESTYLYIQMEYCPRTLRQMFESYSHLDKELAWHLFRQIVEGLTHIHGQGIIHRDLTPNNIFFDARNDIKIGDFGLAKFLKLEQLDQDVDASEIIGVSVDGTGQVGTYFYTAPEIEQRWPKINEKADMYSLGVVFFELWHPFDTAMERHIVLSDLKQKGEVPPAWAAEYPEQSSLLRRLMSPSPSDRPSAVELLQNSFPPRMESNCRFVKLAFKFKRHLLIVQDSEYEPPCHPSFTNTVSDILVDLSLSEYRPKIVETIPLLDGPSIKLHYHVSLIGHITELALQIFRLGSVQPKSFRLQDKPPARRNHYFDDFDIEVSGLGLGHFGRNSVFGLPETSGETDLSGSRAGDRVEFQALKNDSVLVPICLDFSRSDSERCWGSCSYPKSILNLGKWVVLRSLQTRYPFRFENMWLRVDDFKDGVAGWWSNYAMEGMLSFWLAKKLRLFKKDLREWNKGTKVLDEIVSTPKNALWRVDRFLGATLAANEVLDSRRKQGVPGWLCKLDLEKAYDHVSWSFLDFIMTQMGFVEKWR